MACTTTVGKSMPSGDIVGTNDSQTLTNKTIAIGSNSITGSNWQVFYTDGSGALTQLPLGSAGSYLGSNGASSAPSWSVPAGSGDVSKVGTPVDNQIGVWTGDGTIEGDPNFIWNGTNQVFGTGSGIATGTGAGNTLLFRAYDVDGASYTTFATLTANNTPTMDLSTAVTRGGNAIVDVSSNQTLTAKTIDASSNTIQNLTTSEFSAATLVTAGDTIAANNNDTTIPTSAAVKAYADGILAANDAMVYKGVIDASTNPNYPAADAGDTYKISVAGKIGGASGPNVEVGDMIICTVDSTASGDHATVGANWTIIQSNLDGAVIGPASSTNTNIVTFDGTTGKLVADGGATIAQVRDRSTHTGTQLLSTISDAGTIASQNANSVSITGGSITGITDLAIADGGTGASTATQARQNLGLEIGVNVQAWDADLDTWATKTAPTGTVVGTTDTQTLTNKTIQLVNSASPTPTTEGQIEWDNDNDRIVIGDGTGQKIFYSKTENDTLYAASSHTHSTTDITSGTLVVARGGTGISSVGSNGQVLTSTGTVFAMENPLPWLTTTITGDTTAVARTHYLANDGTNAAIVTLPTTAIEDGDVVKVTSINANGWELKPGTGQTIHFLGTTVTQAGGTYFASDATNDYSSIEVTYIGSSTWVVTSAVGCIEVV